MKNNYLLRFLVKTFFWFFCIFTGGITLLLLFTLPTAINENLYDTLGLLNVSLHIISSIGILGLLYYYIYRHTFINKKNDFIMRLIFSLLFIIPNLLLNIISPLDSYSNFSVSTLSFFGYCVTSLIILLLMIYPQRIIDLFKEKI